MRAAMTSTSRAFHWTLSINTARRKGKNFQDEIIDLSDVAAQDKFFPKKRQEYDQHSPDSCSSKHWQFLPKAAQDKEVLVKWRGTLPIDLLEVVDSETGIGKGKTVRDMLLAQDMKPRAVEIVC